MPLTSGPRRPSSVAPAALAYITLGGDAHGLEWQSGTPTSGTSPRTPAEGINYIWRRAPAVGHRDCSSSAWSWGRIAHRAHSVEIAQDEAKVGAIDKDPAVAHKV